MTSTKRKLGTLVAATVLLVGLVSVTGVGTALGQPTAAAQGVSLSCVGSSGGGAYVTDSGLTVYENDSDVTYGTFGGSESVTFGNLTLSAAGTATARVDDAGGSSGHVCLGNVDASANAVTVTLDDTEPVVLEADLTAFAYRDPVYDPGDTDADLVVEAGGSVPLTVESTGLESGETVVATDVGDGTELDRTDVAADGSLALSLPDGTHRVDLHTDASSPGDGDDGDGDTDGGDDGYTGGGDGDSSDDEQGDDEEGDDGETDEDRPGVTIRSASISRTTVEVGTTVAVNVTLATDGARAANYTVSLHVDGVHVGNETVSLPADGDRTITLTHTFDAPGEYELSLGNESLGSVTVEPGETATTTRTGDGSAETTETEVGTDRTTDTAAGATTSAPVSSPTEGTTDGNVPGFGAVASVLALLATVLIAHRRH